MSDANPHPNFEAGAREINAQAASWIERGDREDWDDAGKAALNAWLEESPAHRIAYWRLNGAWGHTDLLGALRPPAREQFVPRKSNIFKIAAALAVIAIFGAGAAFFLSAPEDRVYSTAVGGHESIAFTDGSRIELNTNTRLRARMTTAQRIVWLDKGEAYFTVKHDATHPFVVIAGNHRVTDLGTKFLVHRRSGGVEVALLEGSAEFSTANVRARAQSALLMPGDVAVGTSASISVTKKSAPELSRELGWRSGVLVFKRTALADAVAEFNRYNVEKLVIADPEIGRLTLGGTFKAQHVEDFTQLVQLVLGLRVENKGNEIVISR